MRKEICLLLVIFFSVFGAATAEWGGGATFYQQKDQVTLNSSHPQNFSSINVSANDTGLGKSNFSINPSTQDDVDVAVDKYNASAKEEEFAANFSADTIGGNTVTFSFSNLVANTFYLAKKNDSETLKFDQSDNTGFFSFENSDWSTQNFTVKRSESFARNILTFRPVLHRQNRFNVEQNLTVRFNATHPDGRNNLDMALINISNAQGGLEADRIKMTSISNIVVDGSEGKTFEYNLTMPTDPTKAGEWGINVSINDTDGAEDTNSTTFIQQIFSVSEGSASQGNAKLGEEIKFDRTDSISNPSNVKYEDAKVTVSIPTDTNSASDVTVTNPNGLVKSDIDVNISEGEVSWNISSAPASYDETWDIEYNITPLKLRTENFTTIENQRDKWKKQLNVSNRVTEVDNVFAESSIFEPNDSVEVELFEDGTEITNDADFDVSIASDLSLINWTIPTVTEWRNFTIVSDRGIPIRQKKETIITNRPIIPGENIQWRRCFRFGNENSFSTDFSTKTRPPDGAFSFRLEEGCSNDIESDGAKVGTSQDLSFDSNGQFIPINANLPANSNRTYGLWFQTDSIVTDFERDVPETFFVGEDADVQLNFSVISESPLDISTDEEIEMNVPIDFGENVEMTEVDGDLSDSFGTVRNDLKFNVSNLSSNERRTFQFDYTFLTASEDVVMRGTSENGNNLTVYRIRSLAPQPLQDVRLYLDDVDSVFVENATLLQQQGEAYVFEEELEVEGGRRTGLFEVKSTQIKLGSLGQRENADPIYVGVEYRSVDPVVDMTRQEFFSFLALWLGRSAFLLVVGAGGYLLNQRFQLLG